MAGRPSSLDLIKKWQRDWLSNRKRLKLELTERKRAQAALASSEALFRTVVESMEDVVFLLDNEQRYKGIWGKWLEKHGLTSGMFLGKTSWEIFGEETKEFFEPMNVRVLAGEVTVYERWFDVPWGRVFYHTALYPVRDDGGKVTGIVGLGRDLTERKLLEENIKTLEGILPICASCKKIRDDEGRWVQVEAYVRDRTNAQFSHGICPDCRKELYPV